MTSNATAATATTTTTKSTTPKPMQVVVFGRVEYFKRHKDFYYIDLRCPAKDEYSTPSVVQIKSETKLGEKGEEIKQLCELSGYRGRSFDIEDGKTGEVTTVSPVRLMLQAI